MAEKHYVDPKDQHIAAEGVPSHSELAGMYRNAKTETLGPWMQEADRQAAMEKERTAVMTNLRKSALRIGLYLSLPVILGILLGQLAFFRADPGLNEADAMILAFALLFLLAGWAILVYNLLKRVGETFRRHTLKSPLIVLTTLLSLVFLIHPIFHLTDVHIGGLVGYGVGMASLLITGVLITVISIYVWTAAKIPPLVKILILLLFLGGAVAAAYLL